MSVFISVVMPVYNNEIYFPRAVNSVLEQSFRDVELIIVDDGSTDRTPEIADAFSRRDKRVKVIHQENQWIYASFNHGIAAAEGEYVYVLNSDDRLRDGALEVIAAAAQKYHPDVVWTKVLTHICDQDQRILVYDSSGVDKKISRDLFCEGRDAVRDHWIQMIQCDLSTNQANLYRRTLMLRHPFRNDVYGGDVFFNIDIASDVESFYACASPVYDFFLYEQSKGNASSGKYYGYEHRMFHEFYEKYTELYRSWGRLDHKTEEVFVSMRLQYVSVEIHALTASNCGLTTDEKIRKVLTESADSLTVSMADRHGLREELEGRVIGGIREILNKEQLIPECGMQFVDRMLKAMIRWPKTDADLEEISRGVYHPSNPMHIGESFLKAAEQKKIDRNAGGPGKGRRKLILYGAGDKGRIYAPYVSREFDLIGFCDGNPRKIGGSYCGKPVFGMDQLKDFPDALLYITVFDTKIKQGISDALAEAGFHKNNILEGIM